MTSRSTTEPRSAVTRDASLAGWVCLLLAILASSVLLFGDPYWLSLPLHLAAIGVGAVAMRRGAVDNLGTQLGFNMALFVLFLWVIWQLSPLILDI